jgi:hypothetical protein
MAQYSISIDYNDEPYETGLTLDELIALYLPAGVSFVRYAWRNPHQPNDVTIIVSANDDANLDELCDYAGVNDPDELERVL